MIDPITAITVATTAFNTIKKLVSAGRELEDIMGTLGKWYGAAADLAQAERQRKNPPLFRRIIHGRSVEEEALQILIHRKKLMKQEYELRTMLEWRFGPGTWKELVEERRKIRKERQDQVYRQMAFRQNLIDWVLVSGALMLLIGTISAVIYFIGITKGWWSTE
jgi:hypothetical protein